MIGTSLSHFKITAKLGQGGMGEVYRADDLKLGQAVALKFLPPGLEADDSRLQRLLNEVKLARQIAHPNVCRVYDVGDVDGQAFLSMEYVDGEDLASLLRRIGRRVVPGHDTGPGPTWQTANRPGELRDGLFQPPGMADRQRPAGS